jgi:PKD repeat protein
MKHIYNSLLSSTFSDKSFFKLLAGLIIVFLIVLPPKVWGEGTKQLEPTEPNASNCSLGLVFYQDGWTSQGQRIPFASVGCLEKYRLNVYISDPSTELIYFGFKQDGNDPLFYQLRDPDDLVVPGFSLTTQPTVGNNGYIVSWDEAVAGPHFGTTNPLGYKPLVVTPTKVGNYYLEFATDALGNTNFPALGTALEFFDMSIYVGNNIKDGRVWSRAWQFSNQIVGNNSPKSEFYILSNDSIVTKLNINRWEGGHFMFYCNQWGAVNTGNWISDRQSRTAQNQSEWPGDFPEYKVFLNDPDVSVFPTGSFGILCEDPTSISYCDGTIDILVKVNKPGTVTLDIDVDPLGPGPEDVVLSGDVLGSSDCSAADTIPWNGLDGTGQPVQNGASIHMDIKYINGLTNLPIYDIEENDYGIMVDLVRPIPSGSSKLNIFWDDINLNNCNPVCQDLDGCIYNSPDDACHKWPGPSQGNMDIYNSWWFYQTNATINLALSVIRTPALPAIPFGTNPVCQGQNNVTYSVPAVASADKYIWFLPDGTTDTTAVPSITISFGASAVNGQISVKGFNGDCGYGPVSPVLNITVNPNPAVSMTGPATACQGTTSTYSVGAGLTSYLWSANGGTIVGPNTNSSAIVSWNTATGLESVSVITTSFTCPNTNLTTPVLVHPQPTAGFTWSNNCQGATVQYNDGSSIASGSIVSWNWNFGDGNTSTLQNPTHIYLAAGNYNVSLSVTSALGCASTVLTNVVSITASPTADAGPPASICQNSSIMISTAMATNFSSVSWATTGTGILTGAGTLTPTYTPGVGETGNITLTLTSHGNVPCGNATDQMNLTIDPLPTSNAGANSSICANGTYTLNGTATNASSVHWTGTGTGFFSNANILTPVYTPSPADIAAGSVVLSLTATGALTCNAATQPSSMVLTINPVPTVNAGLDATICANSSYTLSGATASNYSALLWSTGGDGSFNNMGLLNPVYTPGPNDIAMGSVTLTLTATGALQCNLLLPSDDMVLSIDPMPTVNAGPDGAYCVNGPLPQNGSATNYTSVQWISSGDGTFSNPAILNPTYSPGPMDLNAGTVTLTLRAFGSLTCTGVMVSDPRVLSVTPFPTVNAGNDDYICSNVTTYQLSGSMAMDYQAGSLIWTVIGGDGFLDDPTLLHPTYTTGPIDRTTINRAITFRLTVGGTGNCLGQTTFDDVLLLVDPIPVGNAGPNGSICGMNSYQLNGTAQYYSIIAWSSTGDGTFNNPGILNPTYTPGAADLANGNATLTMALSGCLNGGDNLLLIVYTEPTAVMSGSTLICEGATTPITLTLTGTAPWSITYTDGTTPSTVNGIASSPYVFTVSPSVSTTYSMTALSDLHCPGPPGSYTGVAAISVNPLPDLFTMTTFNNGNYCQGDSGVHIGLSDSQANMVYQLLLNGNPSGGLVNGTGNAIDFGLFTVPGQYTVRGTNPVGNCDAMMNGTVNVVMNPIPVTDFTTNTACVGDSTFFTVTGQYINQISYWHWQFGDGTYETYNAPHPPVHLYPVAGTFTVILSVTDTNGCSYQVSHMVTVNPLPQAFFSFSTPACDSTAIHFTDLSNTAMPYIKRWHWDFGDGHDSTVNFPDDPNPSHTYAGTGSYLVTLTILNSSGCSNSYSATVTVTALPSAGFTFTTGCAGQQVSFTDNSLANGGGAITTWQWDFGEPASGVNNTSALPSPTHAYATGGTYTVQLITTNFNGCSDTVSHPVTIQSGPLADFTMSAGCIGSPTQFWADSVLINVNTISGWLWDFGDGNTDNNRNTSNTYTAPGIYTVRLTITDLSGCMGFFERQVTIHPLPQAHFDATLSNCKGEDVSFTDLSTIGTGYILRWHWDFGDGHDTTITFPGVPNVNHLYLNSGSYLVTLTVTGSDSCQNHEIQQVNVIPGPLAAYQYTGACQGSAVVFTDQSLPNGGSAITQWAWDFDDPASGAANQSGQPSPWHQFTGTGPYDVKLIVTTNNGCQDSITQTITLSPTPAVAFTSMYRCQQSPVAFTPAVVMNTTAIAQWHWDFGDGNTSTLSNPTNIYNSAGTYTVHLSVTDTAGCSNDTSQFISIVPLPLVNFDYSSPSCHQDTTFFTSLATTSGGYIVRWIWDFGDGNGTVVNFPDNANVSHLYANSGTFSVTLTVVTSDSCTNVRNRTVTIMPNPVAAFSHGSPCAGTAVNFTDNSQGNGGGSLTGWLWDFGDPATGMANSSTLANPAHTYATAGTYMVKLTVYTANGCSDADSSQITIAPPPTVDFSSQASCAGDTTAFTSIVNAGATAGWNWNFGDGGASALPDPTHIYILGGTFTVTLTITDTAGCQNTISHQVTIIPGPAVYFSTGLPLCSGQVVIFSDGTVPGAGSTLSSWHWDFGDGHDTTLVAPWSGQIGHTYALGGTFNVILSVTTSLGCENSYQHAISIGTAPAAGFTYANTCQGSTTLFTDQTITSGGPPVVGWQWDFGDPGSGIYNTSTLTNPTHIYSQVGSYTVTEIVVNAIGCSDTLIPPPVIIHARPGVDFTYDSITCQGDTTRFQVDATATDIGLIQGWDWNFGDGTAHATQQNPSHIYANAGIYTVTLSVNDTLGCDNQISHQVDVRARPTAAFSFSSACMQAPTQFTDQSYAPSGEVIVGWAWDFGIPALTTDTSSLQNPTYTYNQSGTYTVTLTVTTMNGCTRTTAMSVQVNAKPHAHFTYTASPCSGGAVVFQDSSWSYQGVITSWQWEFEPNQYSNLQNPVHVYFNTDSCYMVQLIVTDMRGCMDTTLPQQEVCVPAPLQAGIGYTGVCLGSPMQFAPMLVAPTENDTLLGFTWDFGDPASGTGNSSTLRLPAHTYGATGNYTVSLTATDLYGCQATAYQAVTVNALPQSAFTWVPGICDSTISFTQTSVGSSGPVTRWIWDYGDGTSYTAFTAALANTQHLYATAGNYLVTLEVSDTNGCIGTFSDSVTRGSCLVAGFTSNDTLCQGENVHFTDQSSSQGPISQWAWDFGDPASGANNQSNLKNPSHTYLFPGIYTVKLRISTLVGAAPVSDSIENQVMIRPSPSAGFDARGTCLGSESAFTNTTIQNGASPGGYSWDFGVPGITSDTSSLTDATYLYPQPGSYQVRLVAMSKEGCNDTTFKAVSVFGIPQARFDYTNVCKGLPTYLFDHSDTALAPLSHWSWRISDSLGVEGTATGANAMYTFLHTGKYKILLTVSDTNGCADNILMNVRSLPVPMSAFDYTKDFEGVQGQLQMENQATGAQDYQWDFGNGTTSSAENPRVRYDTDSTYTIVLVAWNKYNCPDTSSMQYKLLFKGLYVPNAFSPGNPHEEVRLFRPVGVNLVSYHVAVYNSYGNLIWESEKLDAQGSPAEAWDGTYKGTLCQQDVYLWRIRAIFKDGTIWEGKDTGNYQGLNNDPFGTVTLIR